MVFCHLNALSDGEFPEMKCTSLTSQPNSWRFSLLLQDKRGGSSIHVYVFTNYAQAIMNYRMGIRRNNARLIKSALFKFMDLFYGRNHPTYQHIESYLIFLDMSCPAELKDLLDSYFSISTSNDPSKGEDWDFVLENIHKSVKSWIPKGEPSESKWLSACRNFDALKALKDKIFKSSGISRRNEVIE